VTTRLARVWQRALLLAVAVALLTGAGRAEEAESRPEEVESRAERRARSHERMVALLADIVARTPDDNAFIGDREVRKLRRQRVELKEEGGAGERLRNLLALSYHELRLGNEEAAIARGDEAYALAKTLGDKLPARWSNHVLFALANAHMRRGETENCCKRNSPESCLLPLRGGGVHTDQAGSRSAIRYFEELLAKDPSHRRARWLLNIAYMTIDGYPDDVPERHRIAPEVFASDEAFPRFENIAARLGVDSFNLLGGTVVDDLDNDGDLDILTSTWDPNGPMHLHRNEGDGTFTDRTAAAGLTGLLGGINMLQADYDGDGFVDIFVLRGAWLRDTGRHPNSLLRNDGDGTFTDVTFEAGLGDAHYPTQTAGWADYDNDGDLDLYVGNEYTKALAAPGQLYRNDGDGTFSEVAAAAGVTNGRLAKGVTWGDFDGDRYPDLYVSNLLQPNRLYRNQRDGTFVDIAGALGVDRPVRSFPVWFWDFDNDGVLDLYVPSYRGESGALRSLVLSYLGEPHEEEMPRLYRGDGAGGFTDVAGERGLDLYVLPMGCNFGDLDNDGWLDFYLGTGYPNYEALMPNVMYRNVGGERFVDVTTAGGFGHLQKGHGIAFADLDHDGDQDVFAEMGGAFPGDAFNDALFENPGFDNHWLTIQLVGKKTNRSAIGARIRVVVQGEDGRRSIYKHVNSGGSFGANPLRQTIGLGQAKAIVYLEVSWPTSDTTQIFRSVAMDQFIRVEEGSDSVEVLALERFELGGRRGRAAPGRR